MAVCVGWLVHHVLAAMALPCRWTQKLGFTLPEMVYAENGLHLWHQPSGTWAAFTTYGALREVRRVAARDQIQVGSECFPACWARHGPDCVGLWCCVSIGPVCC